MKEKENRFWTAKNVEKILLTLFAIAFICTLLYAAIKPASNSTIKFEVTGISPNNLNASSLVMVHFECIKYCTSHVSNSYMSDCWNQCTQLGKEVCNGAKSG